MVDDLISSSENLKALLELKHRYFYADRQAQ